MKGDLRVWNKPVFGYVEKVINDEKVEIECLDAGLMIFSVSTRKKWSNGKSVPPNSFAKEKWLLDGNSNSGFFHSWINKRCKLNEIDGLLVSNIWTDSVEGVRNEVFRHFQTHFSSYSSTCLSLSA